ncbi:MAG: hypothetical protein IJT54_06490, partial [Candidatus Methanomethylophilaceae archaeon]|nr:hypothetical protein [Candidatus Methanomethylophilaceae archaeon]
IAATTTTTTATMTMILVEPVRAMISPGYAFGYEIRDYKIDITVLYVCTQHVLYGTINTVWVEYPIQKGFYEGAV